MAIKARAVAPKPILWVEVDFGDTDVVVLEHHDGMFEIIVSGSPVLLLNAEQCRRIVNGVRQFGAKKGWTA